MCTRNHFFSDSAISRGLEPEHLNTFQKTLIYLLIDGPFNFLRATCLPAQLLMSRTVLAIELYPVQQDKDSHVVFQKAVTSNSYCRCLIVGKWIVTN